MTLPGDGSLFRGTAAQTDDKQWINLVKCMEKWSLCSTNLSQKTCVKYMPSVNIPTQRNDHSVQLALDYVHCVNILKWTVSTLLGNKSPLHLSTFSEHHPPSTKKHFNTPLLLAVIWVHTGPRFGPFYTLYLLHLVLKTTSHECPVMCLVTTHTQKKKDTVML